MFKLWCKHVMMRSLVWNMRWMTRYLNVITRPFVRWYANKEIIACGLREGEGVYLIYSPAENKESYSFWRKRGRRWNEISVQQVMPWSDPLVQKVRLEEVEIGDVVQVRGRFKETGKKVISPTITVKKKSGDISHMLRVERNGSSDPHFFWSEADELDPMIYFLSVDDDQGQTLSGVYTRETYWEYPLIEKASLSLHCEAPKIVSDVITARLVVVDFDGWVSAYAKVKT